MIFYDETGSVDKLLIRQFRSASRALPHVSWFHAGWLMQGKNKELQKLPTLPVSTFNDHLACRGPYFECLPKLFPEYSRMLKPNYEIYS